jgi:translation initiation factor 1
MNKTVYREFGESEGDDGEETIELSPQEHNLKIQASRKGKGGKTVTIVSGFQLSSDRLVALAKQLKTQCGTGGTVKDGTIEIQGDFRQKLLETLTKLGYKAKVSGG